MPGTARLTLAATPDSPLAALSREPGVRVEATFLGRALLVRLAGETATAERLAKAFAAAGATLEGAEDAAGLVFLAPGGLPEARLAEAVERHGGVVLPPLRWARGEMRMEVLQLREGLVESVRREVDGVRVARKKPMPANEAGAEALREGLALPGMTRKQAQAILAALDSGYYDVPRKVTTRDVAKGLGVARSTFEEHLKRAEGQFVAALAPLARLRLMSEGGAHAEALRLYSQFSASIGLYVTLAVRGEAVEKVTMGTKPPEGAEQQHPWLARVLEHLSTGKGDLDGVPLHLEVTPFEQEVLEAIRAIPPGEVATYGELARRIGHPKAARAVANACAHNPVPLIIPCHRVVQSDGGLGGYSGAGGKRTKARLLAVEGASPGAAAPEKPRRARRPAR